MEHPGIDCRNKDARLERKVVMAITLRQMTGVLEGKRIVRINE